MIEVKDNRLRWEIMRLIKTIERLFVLLIVCFLCLQTMGSITIHAFVSQKNEQTIYSIRDIAFSYTDYRFPEEKLYFNGNDGKSHILVFGGVATCYNTICTNIAIKKLLEETDGNVEVNVFDIADGASSEIIKELNEDQIPKCMHVSQNENSLYKIAYKAVGINGGFTMPLVCYVDSSGNIQKATTGPCSYDMICSYAIKYTTLSRGIKSQIMNGTISYNCYYEDSFKLFELINQERIKNGLSVLSMDQELLQASKIRALEASVLFCDTRPDGRSYDSVSSKVDTEILIPNGYNDAGQLNTTLFKTVQEKAVLLDSKYTCVGITKICRLDNNKTYWALCFGTGTIVPASAPQDEIQQTGLISVDIGMIPFSVEFDNKKVINGQKIINSSYSSGKQIKIYAGVVLNNRDFIFTSSNPKSMSISEEGCLVVTGAGTTTITITSKYDSSFGYSFVIDTPDPYVGELIIGETKEIELYFNDSEGWVSLDPDIVSVRNGNTLVALKEGIAYIVETSASTNQKVYKYVVVKDNASVSNNKKKSNKYKVGSFEYQVTKSKKDGTGTVKLVRVLKKDKTVKIPNTIKISGVSYKVTEIADNVFKSNKVIEKLTIGSNISKIGNKSFYDCTKLKEITIGKNVSRIGKQAFYNCKNVQKFTVQSTKLASSRVGAKAFSKLGSQNYRKVVVKLPSDKKTAYKKLFKAKGISSKVQFKYWNNKQLDKKISMQ